MRASTKVGIVIIAILMALACWREAHPAELWKVTYYCSCSRCCGRWSDGYFASGKRVYDGGVAVNWLPFGTKIKIDGVTYTVEDRGAVKYFGTRQRPKLAVDVWMKNHWDAVLAGVKYLPVEVVRR